MASYRLAIPLKSDSAEAGEVRKLAQVGGRDQIDRLVRIEGLRFMEKTEDNACLANWDGVCRRSTTRKAEAEDKNESWKGGREGGRENGSLARSGWVERGMGEPGVWRCMIECCGIGWLGSWLCGWRSTRLWIGWFEFPAAMDNKEGIVHEGQREDQPDVRAAAASNATDALHALRVSSAKPQQDVSTRPRPDVQSLHNRVSALEDSWRAWTNSQPGQTPSIPPPGCASSSSTHPPPPPPPTALIAAASPSDDLASALVGLDDVSSLWATHLGVNLASLSLRPSTPEYEDDDDEDEPEGVLRAKQIPMSSRMGVTLSHIALLPPRHIRSHLWNAAQLVIGPHAGLSRRTRIRFERMCTDIQGEKSKKWPLSLLAVGTAGLAIGAQVVSESAMSLPHSPTPSTSTSSASPLPTLPPCHRALYTLSNRSLSPNAHDTDAVLAALLHAAHGTLDGRARVKPSVWPDVCRAVGVARGMGLGMGIQKGVVQDDVEEWRVRVWWEVYCSGSLVRVGDITCFLTSSCDIGVPALTHDNTFSATLPSQTEPSDPAAEGEKPDGLAYFFHKCR
ncbi:fungal specific transcription factor domain-containing protein [Rhizoctonia solani AG-1 IA]|uniref:Fungal specific transcription factor domain-containing protein n=1 Tax=Thanatephorus cucumeris (strain AG1-IA) TaxID=983506 RepID=L8WXU6_THACA|nr:fungal specific transcription factor domain-containing protein [Rhizoctonia solani AG-1 IA]